MTNIELNRVNLEKHGWELNLLTQPFLAKSDLISNNSLPQTRKENSAEVLDH
jgi:hypothetical protein